MGISRYQGYVERIRVDILIVNWLIAVQILTLFEMCFAPLESELVGEFT